MSGSDVDIESNILKFFWISFCLGIDVEHLYPIVMPGNVTVAGEHALPNAVWTQYIALTRSDYY